MKCVICKQGQTESGTTTVIFEREALTLVVKDVPAQICQNCGEDYIDEQVSRQLLKTAEELALSGTQVEIRHFVAA
jgi:YgiT-type zinc finger domain-containing protein